MKQPLNFLVMSHDARSAEQLREALSAANRGRVFVTANRDGWADDIARFNPSVVVITLDAQPEATLATLERFAAAHPATMFICASASSSSEIILRSLRAGAREFLRLPIAQEELLTVLERAAEFRASHHSATKKHGRMIAVFSHKGGCGTSFFAANLAAAMKVPTILVDLNLQGGDQDLYFGIDSEFSIVDLVRNRARVDDSLLRSYVKSHSPTLSVMTAPREAADAEEVQPDHIFEVMQILRERHDCIVIDAPHGFDSVTLSALDQADEIMLVLTIDIPGIRSAQRALALFDRLGYSQQKVRVVVNRWSKGIEIDLKQVERSLGGGIFGFVPNDYRAVIQSLNFGTTLVEAQPSSKIALEIKRIAASITATQGTAGNEERKKGLSWFLRRNTEPPKLELRTLPD